MDRDTLMLFSLCAQMIVLMAALITITPGRRRHRIGITLMLCWVSVGLCIYGLRTFGQGLSNAIWATWYAPLGGVLSAWAVLDLAMYVHRLRDRIGGIKQSDDTWHDLLFRVRE